MMSGRTWEAGSSHRFGFNGKEFVESEYFQDYGMRAYLPLIARFISVDPLRFKYPELSTYQFASNTPIWASDVDGLEAWVKTRDWSRKDLFGFQRFVNTEIERITSNDTEVKYDCADLAVHLLITYAAENGLPVEFTDIYGRTLDAQDPSNPEGDVNAYEIKVRGLTKAASIRDNEMSALPITENPIPGDMTNSGTHVNIVISGNPERKEVPEGYIPSVSGTDPPEPITNQKYSYLGAGNTFYRWNYLSNMPNESLPEVVTPISTERMSIDQNPTIKNSNATQ